MTTRDEAKFSSAAWRKKYYIMLRNTQVPWSKMACTGTIVTQKWQPILILGFGRGTPFGTMPDTPEMEEQNPVIPENFWGEPNKNDVVWMTFSLAHNKQNTI